MQVSEPPVEAGPKKRRKYQRRHWLDYAIFIVETLGLVGLGIYASLTWGIFRENKQAVTEMQRQIRIDERPWIKVSSPEEFKFSNGKPIPVSAGQPLQVPIEFTNYGKTAARKVTTGITIEVFPMGEEPDFPDGIQTVTFGTSGTSLDTLVAPPGERLLVVYPSEVAGTGIIEPGENVNFTISRVKITGGKIVIDPVSKEELEGLRTGRAYIALWGAISYSDIFGVQHQTKFCQAIPREATLKKCAENNEVDSNDGTDTTKKRLAVP